MMRLSALGAALGAVAVVASACGGGTTNSSSPTTAGTTPSAPASTSATSGVTTVTVQMSEFRLDFSQNTFAPGNYNFVATNVGRAPHALEIDGPGVTDQRTPGVVAAGQSATLTVTLSAGSYHVYCPVGHHKEMGMETHITVGSAGGSTTAPGPTSGSGGY